MCRRGLVIAIACLGAMCCGTAGPAGASAVIGGVVSSPSASVLASAGAKLRRLHVPPTALLPTRAPRSFRDAAVSAQRTPGGYEVDFIRCCDRFTGRTLIAYFGRITESDEQSLLQVSQLHGYAPTPQRVRGHDGLFIETHESLRLVWQENGQIYAAGTHTALRYTLTRRQLLSMASSARPV